MIFAWNYFSSERPKRRIDGLRINDVAVAYAVVFDAMAPIEMVKKPAIPFFSGTY